MIYSRKANGNIAPSRFVKVDTSGDELVAQAGAGEDIFGISQAGTRRVPYGALDDGYAAIAGEDLEVFSIGEVCLLELGGTVTAGARLKADSNGKGVTASSDADYYGAIAEVSGIAGDLIQVKVMPHSQRAS